MARPRIKAVEPKDPPSIEAEAIAIFCDAGWPRRDAEWIGPVCAQLLRRRFAEDAAVLEERRSGDLRAMASVWSTHGNAAGRDRALVGLYAVLCGCGGQNSPFHWPSIHSYSGPTRDTRLDLAEWQTLAGEFRRDRAHAKGVDFEGTISGHGWPGRYGSDAELAGAMCDYAGRETPNFHNRPDLARLMDVLVQGAGLDLTRVIDVHSLIAQGLATVPEGHLQPRVPAPSDRHHTPSFAPPLLSTWLFGLGPRALKAFYPALQAEDRETKGALATRIRFSIERWLNWRTGHWMYFREVGPELAVASTLYFDHLEACLDAFERREDLLLRRAWLWFAWCTFESGLQPPPPDRLERVLRAATEDIARLRKLLARATPKPANLAPSDEHAKMLGPGEHRESWEEFEWEQDHFQTCANLLHLFGGAWRGMKPMLLAIRALAAPSVPTDLRYWGEANREPPPEPWCAVTAWTINFFQNLIRYESDPELVKFRGELGTFLLERLVDRWSQTEREEAKRTGRARTDDDMVERSPDWRYCLIRAFAALGVNPGGRGHRALHTSSEIDPHEYVRDAARDAYEQLRRGVGLPEGVSPRRAVMTALWWYRQAHLLGLGIQPDDDGAQRTRAKELTRIKEMERANKPATRDDSLMWTV